MSAHPSSAPGRPGRTPAERELSRIHLRDTLTAVMEARARAMAATSPADASRKEGELTQAIGRLFAVAENYPQLRANENVKMLTPSPPPRLINSFAALIPTIAPGLCLKSFTNCRR